QANSYVLSVPFVLFRCLATATCPARRLPAILWRAAALGGGLKLTGENSGRKIRILTEILMISTEQPKLTKNEGLKSGNPLLTGTIAQTLRDTQAHCFTHDDYEFLKFHGVYQ